MSAANQVGCEAAESSSEQVTPDSNHDEPLSLMRYKELQFIAMSLNLPGNLKHKMLVDVIRARRTNREGDVDRILAEHRGNRKAQSKRARSSKEETVEGEDLKEGGTDTRTKGQHRKRLKTQIPATTASSPPAAPDPYLARLYGAYAYPMQPKPGAPGNQGVLANYLSSVGPPSSVKNDWMYNRNNSNEIYSSTPAIQVATSPVSYPQAESDSYKQIISCHLSAALATAPDSTGTTHRFIQEEKNCNSLQEQSQIFRMHNFGNNYANKHTLVSANQSTVSYPNLVQSSYTNPQLTVSQPSSDSSYSGYQRRAESSNECSRSMYMKKNIVPQVYGQQYLSNQRFEDREQSLINNEGLHHSVVNNYSNMSCASMAQKEITHSKSWNNSTFGSGALSQQNYRKYPMYGNNGNTWQYQGVPLNYNGITENSSNVAHDLSVSSRRLSQGGNTNGPSQVANECHSAFTQGLALTVNQTSHSPVKPPPHPYYEGRTDSLSHPSKQMADASDQFIDHQVGRSVSDRMALAAYQHIQEEDTSSAHVATYTMKDMADEVTEIPETDSCPENSFNAAYLTTNNDTTMTYCHGADTCPVLSHNAQYSCPEVAPSTSFSGSLASSNQVQSCSTCDVVRSQVQYQPSVNQNVTQSSINQNNQYSTSHGVNYGYNQSQQAVSYATRQSYPYSQFSTNVHNVEENVATSPDQTVSRYFPEQASYDNVQSSYTTQNSMESMWSSVRAPSPELDNSLLTPSPKGSGMNMQQDTCDSDSVFPDEAELDMVEDQSLSFPNIYDYVMASAGEGSADPGIELQGSKESSDIGDSPSPGALQVVEGEEVVDGKSSTESIESLKEGDDAAAEKWEMNGKDEDADSQTVVEDLLNFTDTSSDVQELFSEESSDKSKEDVEKNKKASRRKTRLSKGRCPLVLSKGYHRTRRLRDHSPARRSRSKVGVLRDQITCPHGKKGCKWIGRIHGLASHIRSVHKENVTAGSDTSYLIQVKDLKATNQATFFQEAGGILYLLAVHQKDTLLYFTIQSLPGSGRSGTPPSGSKASLEVLLKNGKSHGWRGRVWGLVAPSILQNQRPLNSASLQERLWSRGDYLSVDPSKVCDPDSKGFRLYVSITPPEFIVSSNSQEFKPTKSPQMSPLQSNPLPQTSAVEKSDSLCGHVSECEEVLNGSNLNELGASTNPSSCKALDDQLEKSPVLSPSEPSIPNTDIQRIKVAYLV